MNRSTRSALVALLALAACLLTAAAANAYTTAPGFAASDFVTNLPNQGPGGVGPVGLAFDSANNLYVMDYFNGVLYKFGASGGSATDPANRVGDTHYGSNNAAGITFSPSGRLYVSLQRNGTIDEISPADAHAIRTIASGICTSTGIATDPATGDFFAGFGCSGLLRIHGYEPGPATATVVGPQGIDGITVGPDGSLYLAQFGNAVLRLERTGPNSFGALTTVANVPTSDGTAVAPSLDPAHPYVFANRNDGIVTKIDTTTSPATLTNIFSGGSRGDFSTVGPDGCLYITQTDRIVKITNADGTCSFIPTSALPQIALAPPTQTDHIGDSATVTATLTNIPVGTVVTFDVTGANAGTFTRTADASGVVSISYAGANTGDDTVVASAHVGALTPTSTAVTVHWEPPLDATPPEITSHVSGPAGDNGWYTGNTTVTWTVTDPESPVTSTTGCDPTTLSGYHAGEMLTCSATSLGGTASASVTVKIDDTPPNVTPNLVGTPGNNGWWIGPVTVNWTMTDGESGIAETCSSTTLSSDGASQTATCTAKNGAGLTTTATKTVDIDQTAPSVTFVGNAGVYDVSQVVAISCNASDNLSGLASTTCTATSGPAWTFGLGAHTVSATATDNAGNTGSGSTTFTVGVSADGVCALVQQWVSNAGIANSLCAKLRAAAAARARGQNNAADNVLAAFRSELGAQSGKALTAAHAATLAALSTSL